MRPGAVAALVSTSLLLLGAAPADGTAPAPLPARMADTGGGTHELITAVARRTPARPRGPSPGGTTWAGATGAGWRPVRAATRVRRTSPTGRRASRAPAPPRPACTTCRTPSAPSPRRPARRTVTQVHEDSWWCQDNASRSYNRWTEPLPADCRATEAEHLVTYPAQYAHALVVGFNYVRCAAAARASSCTSRGAGRRPAACRCRRRPCGGSCGGPSRGKHRTSRSAPRTGRRPSPGTEHGRHQRRALPARAERSPGTARICGPRAESPTEEP
ncbi:hypothetical protein STENM327S_01442 [Streptomyces tendae]